MKYYLVSIFLLLFNISLKSQDHSKYFIGIGYNLILSEELSTGLEIIYGTSGTLEAKLSGTSSGIYIDWIKFYINKIMLLT